MKNAYSTQSLFATSAWKMISLRVALMASVAGASAGASGTTCSPATSGYIVGSGVTYFLKDPASNPPKELEKKVVTADPASFEFLRLPLYERPPCGGRRVEFARDKAQVYYRWQVVTGADPQTYEFIDDHYARDKSAVYSGSKRLTTRVESFQILGAYATDGKKHFYRDVVIRGTGFELLGGAAHSARGYAATDSRVYHNGQIIGRADARSFELFKPEVGITRDKRFVFFNGQVIPGADPKTFEQINGYTFKDKLGVYTEGRKIIGANPSTVRPSEFGNYLIDDVSVYKGGKTVTPRDPATFVELQPQWTKDKNAVYYKDEAVPQIDVASFKTTSLDRGEDRNYRYEELRRVCKFLNDDAQPLPACS